MPGLISRIGMLDLTSGEAGSAGNRARSNGSNAALSPPAGGAALVAGGVAGGGWPHKTRQISASAAASAGAARAFCHLECSLAMPRIKARFQTMSTPPVGRMGAESGPRLEIGARGRREKNALKAHKY